jgi:carbon monoxide dehydrogenase subunit G
MVITSHNIDIAKPLPEVFSFLSDPQNYLLWQSGVISIDATDGMNEDSIITFTSMGLGRKFDLGAKVTLNNGHNHIEAVSTRGPLTFTSKYILEEIDGGTRLHLSNDIRTHGIFQLASGVLQSMGETKYQADLQQLKIVLERNVKSASLAGDNS